MRTLARLTLGFVIAAVLVYTADAAWVRLRLANHREATSTVQVRILLAVPQKGGRVEYIPGDPQTQTCVLSMFPHLGFEPCWYVTRHTRKQVNY